MRFSSKLDEFVKLLVEDKVGASLGNNVVIAEKRVRKEYNIDENARYSVWLRENVKTYIKLDDGDMYEVKYDYLATSKSDDIENLKVRKFKTDAEIIEKFYESMREEYRALEDASSINVDDDIRMKVSRKKLDKYTEENLIVLNF